MTVVPFPNSPHIGDNLPRPAMFPPGLIGDVANFIYWASPYQNETIALAGGIAFVAGIAGRAYNVETAGLNQYVLLLAQTGAGKEAVADGIARLEAAVYSQVPGIAHFRGPGELVSAPGLFKWLDGLPSPVMRCIIGEFGLMLKAMASPNANANMAGLQRVLLHLWSKSGKGAIFDASAYSDREKNTRAIKNPSLTIFGEGVPESFYATLDVGMIASGLLPRVLLFQTTALKPYRNRNRITDPSPFLVEAVARLTSHCLTLAAADRVQMVDMAEDAKTTFEAFECFAVDQENSAANDQLRGLWARLDLKARKLAALSAVGRDPANPVISHDDCMWATNLVVDQTKALIGKFEDGETGEIAGNEVNQQDEVLRCMYEYITTPFIEIPKSYGVIFELQRGGIVPQKYLSMRLIGLPTFKNDRIGATNALNRAIRNLLDADDIKEKPKGDVEQISGKRQRAFVATSPSRMADAVRKKAKGRV